MSGLRKRPAAAAEERLPSEAERDTLHIYAEQQPTGFEVIAQELSSRLHADILTDIVPRLCSGWQPHMNVSIEAHDYMCRHAKELTGASSEVRTSRALAVRTKVQNVLRLLEHLNKTAEAMQREMIGAIDAIESGEYHDDSDG